VEVLFVPHKGIRSTQIYCLHELFSVSNIIITSVQIMLRCTSSFQIYLSRSSYLSVLKRNEFHFYKLISLEIKFTCATNLMYYIGQAVKQPLLIISFYKTRFFLLMKHQQTKCMSIYRAMLKSRQSKQRQ